MTPFLRILAPTLVAMFIMANALPNMASNALAQTQSGVHVLLSKDDPPIHIGDGEGEITDIKQALRSSNPPDRHAWAFELGEVPDRLFFTVTIFSLAHFSEWDCPTTARLNGSRVYDLRDGENVGSGYTTTARFSVGKEHLKGGRNTIEIREENCLDTYFPALNDSLIKGVRYRF
ncbi:MAG: hypothetical protein IID53_08830 [Proteobacteria bacterium]|nr:hypothetical protein [Pseudomonadota bacterium]